MEVPRLGVESELYHWPTPQPQQRQIWTVSATYTTVHGNTRSLTHWARPGLEPASSWMPVRFVPTEPRQELLGLCTFYSWNSGLSVLKGDILTRGHTKSPTKLQIISAFPRYFRHLVSRSQQISGIINLVPKVSLCCVNVVVREWRG